jgi:hypothetical protein
MDIDRVQIVTDSLYVFNNQRMPSTWRRNGWKTSAGRPVENSDLWKRFLALRPMCKLRTDIIWRKGKKSPILKAVDRAAKDAGKAPTEPDRGFRQGKVGRSKISGGASSLYPAVGQEGIIRIYRSALLRKTDHKVYFDVFDALRNIFVEKRTAYASAAIAPELHRGHTYGVRFNSDPKYPQIVEVFGELPTP